MESIWQFLQTETPLLYWTQSLWRDEAFSVLIATTGGSETVRITANDYSPPLYYLLLHVWMQVFGRSEIAIRSLSLLFFLAFLGAFYTLAKYLFSRQQAILVTIAAALSPMLVYYGFEARMYSLYAFTTTLSMYFFLRRKWTLYILATVAALYTHPYTVFTPLSQVIYLVVAKKFSLKTLAIMAIPFVVYLPWMIVIVGQIARTTEMWMFPVDWNLITAVLGNLYTGYEGTPDSWWHYMKIFSLVYLVIVAWSIRYLDKKKRDNFILMAIWLFVPLGVVLGISYFKSIYVNRYLISTSIASVFLLFLAIGSFKSSRWRWFLIFGVYTVSLVYLGTYPRLVKKVDIRSTFAQINKMTLEDDVVYAASPLVFFESRYYFKDGNRVYLYNSGGGRLPSFLGLALIPETIRRAHFPQDKSRVFMVYENGSFSEIRQEEKL